MTLDSLEVDLASVFEAGQAYVALSRATSMLSTRVLSFNPHRVRAHPRVARFYLDLEARQDRQDRDEAAAAAAAAPSTGFGTAPSGSAAAGAPASGGGGRGMSTAV